MTTAEDLTRFYAHVQGQIDSVSALRNVYLEGDNIKADVAALVVSADMNETIEGASTFSMTLHDTDYKVLHSPLVMSRAVVSAEDWAFELAKVSKSGRQLKLTFEDLGVAALRRRDDPRLVEAGKMTHVDFARMLVAEEPWITFHTAPGMAEVSKDSLVRGQPDQYTKSRSKASVTLTPELRAKGLIDSPTEGSGTPKLKKKSIDPRTGETKKEDTWTAIGRIADDRGWRRWMRNGHDLFYLPETYLFNADPVWVLDEFGRNGTDEINFDFDTGKSMATATATVRIGRWSMRAGDCVEIVNAGPANGKWLIMSVSRSLFSLNAQVSLAKPRPVLPEPEGSSQDDDEMMPDEGLDLGDYGAPPAPIEVVPALGQMQWMYPTTPSAPITSPFGPRWGRLHAGIDIGVPVGSPVYATAEGTVIVAETQSGYGHVVYLKHARGETSRYAHLSKVFVSRGQKVPQGGRVGLSGGKPGTAGAGNSQAPHLHFEIRMGHNSNPVDPATLLNKPAHREGGLGSARRV